jgi:tetrahydromethanopterin S-methyltransferase subunit H
LLDVCENNKEVAVLLNFDEDDLSEKKKIKILMEAVVAKHKQVIRIVFFSKV